MVALQRKVVLPDLLPVVPGERWVEDEPGEAVEGVGEGERTAPHDRVIRHAREAYLA